MHLRSRNSLLLSGSKVYPLAGTRLCLQGMGTLTSNGWNGCHLLTVCCNREGQLTPCQAQLPDQNTKRRHLSIALCQQSQTMCLLCLLQGKPCSALTTDPNQSYYFTKFAQPQQQLIPVANLSAEGSNAACYIGRFGRT